MVSAKRYSQILLASAVLCVGSTFAPNAWSDASDGAPHTLNLKDVDINVLIATVSEITGKTFIVDPAVQGKVNVVSSQPLSKAELYQMFLSVLRVHGFSAIEAGSAVRIVPDQKAASDGAVGLGAAGGDEMVTRIIDLKHVTPTEMVQILNPLKSPSAQLISHNASSSLVVADRASNVARMIEIIRRIDQASEADIEVVPLSNANSAEVVRTINGLSGGADPTQKVVADERTNSILLSGDRSRRLKLRALIATLDTPLAGSDTMEVIYLRYADAEQLVGILEGVLRGSRTGSGAPLAGASNAPAGVIGGAPQSSLGSSTVIQAHKETNSLIVTAPPAVLRELKALVRKLDIRRAQVLIEAIIVEISEDNSKKLGIQWQVGDYKSGIVGGTNFPGSPGILTVQGGLAGANGLAGGLATLADTGGLNIGVVRSITLPGSTTPIVQLGALANAFAGDENANVLSRPSTIALDNQKASLSVGREVPFVTGNYQTNAGAPGTGGGANPFQTIERKEVGLKLVVTPHINEGDSVRMDIELEVSDLLPAKNNTGAVDLVTNSRKISTQAIVRDSGMLVLGGLTQETLTESQSRVPGLSKVPLLGNLFKSRGNTVKRSNLLVFIKPTIVRDGMAEDTITFGKYNSIRDDQLRSIENRSDLTPENKVPVLPDLREYLKPATEQTPPSKSDSGANRNPRLEDQSERQVAAPSVTSEQAPRNVADAATAPLRVPPKK